MRPSHASAKHKEGAPPLPKAVKKEKWVKGCMIKGRNEPVTISHVAQVVASVKGIAVEEVCNAYEATSCPTVALHTDISVGHGTTQ
jgi:TatD DNase family protein